MKKTQKLKKLWYSDFYEEEEIGTAFFDYPDEIIKERGCSRISIYRPSRPSVKFKAFLDGTMKIYRVARMMHTGSPMYVAAISCALLERGEDRYLRNTSYSRTLNLLIFPFDRYTSYIKRKYQDSTFQREVDRLFSDFKAQIRRTAKFLGSDMYEEHTLREDPNAVKNAFGHSGNWILCDTSKKGLKADSREYVKEIDLYNPHRLREAARARARYFMGLLEFFCAYTFLENRPNDYLMIDGLFFPYGKVSSIFGITKNQYKAVVERIIGFIKHPRDIPEEVLPELPTLSPNECFCWTGTTAEAEETSTLPSDQTKKRDKQKFKFSLLRFRSLRKEDIPPSPVGIVKLQLSPDKDEESLRKILEAVLYENLPWPMDRRRLYNEPYPIEVAEKVAKSFLPSEERLTGFVYSILTFIE